ncbi:MAG: DUF983 domain-containing protein [Ahrensia sp.]|nr:DUF983 domain-containing protein [Ahrensia sp.]
MTIENESDKWIEKRPVWPAILKGLRGKCPRCGEGRIFHKWLKVSQQCSVCGQDLHHERAQDFPPYVVIVIVGHVVVTALMLVEARTDWSMTTHLLVWIPLTVVLTLALLQPVKGGVVGLQWALKMFGFGDDHEKDG